MQLIKEWNLLKPHQAQNQKLIEQGKRDAQAAIDMGPGKSFENLLTSVVHQRKHRP